MSGGGTPAERGPETEELLRTHPLPIMVSVSSPLPRA